MKVIAIENGPKTKKKWPNGTHRAYHKGDVFDLIEQERSTTDNWGIMLIKYPDTGRLHVTSENFMTLDQWRDKLIDKLIKPTI